MKTKLLIVTHESTLEVPDAMSRIELVQELNKRFNFAAAELGHIVASSTKANGGEHESERYTDDN